MANAGKWKRGKIIRVWDEGNPYRIELEEKRLPDVSQSMRTNLGCP